jgi:hypothetical protein
VRTRLSLQDLVGGHFGGTSPTWAFIGARSPLVGCHGPDLGAVQERNIAFGGKGRDQLEDWRISSSPCKPNDFPLKAKTSL